MNVLLLHPSTFRKNYGEYAAAGGKSQPLGICYIAAVLEKNKIEVEILDADILNLTYEQSKEQILEKNPSILMISILTFTYDDMVKLANEIKNLNKSITIIVGGPHLATHPETTMRNDCFDYGLVGEAEYSSLELAQKILQGEDPKDVRGIIYCRDGEITSTEKRDLIQDLDELPMPAFHLLPPMELYRPQIHSYRYSPVATMVTSRGCPYQCIFCDQGVFGKKFRYMSGKNIANQMAIIQEKYGIREIMFFDDVFTINKQRVHEMCDEIQRRGLKIAWSCSSRADHLDKGLLIKMKEAGCWMIGMGIESGNQQILNFIKKKITLEKIEETVGIAHEVGIKVRGFFQIGHPTETEKTIEDTIVFANSLPLYAADFLISTPFKGTELYDIAEQYGSFDSSSSTNFSKMFPAFTPKGMTQEYLLKKQKQLHRRFYLRPKKVLEYLLLIRTLGDVKRYFCGAKILLH